MKNTNPIIYLIFLFCILSTFSINIYAQETKNTDTELVQGDEKKNSAEDWYLSGLRQMTRFGRARGLLGNAEQLLSELITMDIFKNILLEGEGQVTLRRFFEKLTFIKAKDKLSEIIDPQELEDALKNNENSIENVFTTLLDKHKEEEQMQDRIVSIHDDVVSKIEEIENYYLVSEMQLKKAIEYFDKALELDPQYVNVHIRKAETYLDLGLKREAAESYETCRKMGLDKVTISIDELRDIIYRIAKIYTEGEISHLIVKIQTTRQKKVSSQFAVGDTITVEINVNNVGGIAMDPVILSNPVVEGTGKVSLTLSPPDKVSQKCIGRDSRTYIWEYRAESAGDVTIQGSVSGTDIETGKAYQYTAEPLLINIVEKGKEIVSPVETKKEGGTEQEQTQVVGTKGYDEEIIKDFIALKRKLLQAQFEKAQADQDMQFALKTEANIVVNEFELARFYVEVGKTALARNEYETKRRKVENEYNLPIYDPEDLKLMDEINRDIGSMKNAFFMFDVDRDLLDPNLQDELSKVRLTLLPANKETKPGEFLRVAFLPTGPVIQSSTEILIDKNRNQIGRIITIGDYTATATMPRYRVNYDNRMLFHVYLRAGRSEEIMMEPGANTWCRITIDSLGPGTGVKTLLKPIVIDYKQNKNIFTVTDRNAKVDENYERFGSGEYKASMDASFPVETGYDQISLNFQEIKIVFPFDKVIKYIAAAGAVIVSLATY